MLEQLSSLPIRYRQGPNGPSFITGIGDYLALGNLKGPILALMKFTFTPDLVTKVKGYWKAINDSDLKLSGMKTCRLSFIAEKQFKTRTVAIFDY